MKRTSEVGARSCAGRLLGKEVFWIMILFSFYFKTVNAEVLFLHHFDKQLDADYSQYEKGKATGKRIGLSKEGAGYPYKTGKDKALDAGYSRKTSGDDMILFPSVNFDSRQGTIEMWVKSNWAPTPRGSHYKAEFRTFLSVPLADGHGGYIKLQYAYYNGLHYSPHIMFMMKYFNEDENKRHADNANIRIVHSAELIGGNPPAVLWQKDVWNHLAVSWNPAAIALFVNGKLAYKRTFKKPLFIPPVGGPLAIGNSFNGGEPADALIDEVRVSNQALYLDGKTSPVPDKLPLTEQILGETVDAGGYAIFRKPDPRQYYCYITDNPPKIDGSLNDAVWDKIPSISGFRIYGKNEIIYVPYQCEVKVCRDNKKIYVAMLLFENKFSAMKAKAKIDPKTGKSPWVWGDDSAEIYFSEKWGKYPAAQIGVNSKNLSYDIIHKSMAFAAQKPLSCSYETATGRTSDGWTVEMAFPYENFCPEMPAVGDIWGFRACRNRIADNFSISTFNWGVNGYKIADQYLRLIMAGKVPKLKVVREENHINHDFIAALKKQFAAFSTELDWELGYLRDVDETVKNKHGINTLKKALSSFNATIKVLLRKDIDSPVSAYDLAYMKLNEAKEQLGKLSYLLANFGGKSAKVPPANLKGIKQYGNNWYLCSPSIAAAVNPENGSLAGIWDKKTGQRMVVSGVLLYELQTEKNIVTVDARRDKAVKLAVQDNKLVCECVNPMLPGIIIRKIYFLVPIKNEMRILACKLEVNAKGTKGKQLLCIQSRTLFDGKFRGPSYYDRILVIGTMGAEETVKKASTIVSRMQQRAWFNSDEGRAQFALYNPTTKSGIGEYLYKENGLWTFPQALPSSFWTALGWDMGLGAAFTREMPYSLEFRYHVFNGNSRLVFHQEYKNLPEYMAVKADGAPSVKTLQVAGRCDLIVNSHLDKKTQKNTLDDYIGKRNQALWRKDEKLICAYVSADRHWPDYDVGDDKFAEIMNPFTGKITSRYSCKPVRETIKYIKSTCPPILVQGYDFITDIFKGSKTFKEHPEWVIKTRDGKLMPGYFGPQYFRANWSPGFVEQLIGGLLRSLDYYDLDICYMDFGVGVVLPDWGSERVIRINDYFKFLKTLHSELKKRGKLLFLNSNVGQPYFDIGFFEGGAGGESSGHWRNHANVAMMSKFYMQPGTIRIPLYWYGRDFRGDGKPHNEVAYIDYVLAVPRGAASTYLDPYNVHFPKKDGSADWYAIQKYQWAVWQASNELRWSAWYDIGLTPAWWEDMNTDIEAYSWIQPVRKQGDIDKIDNKSYLVNVISHKAAPQDIKLTVDLKKMRFNPGKRLFAWQFLRRDYASYKQGVPVPKNWDKMFSKRICASSIPGKNKFSYTVPKLEPNRVCVTALTQVPAAIIAADGIITQALLPSVLGCDITGRVNEEDKEVLLNITCDKKLEVIGWWPKKWGKAKIMLNGKEKLLYTPVKFGNEDFVRFKIPKEGKWSVKITK